MSSRVRLVDVLAAGPAVGSPRGVTLSELSGYLATRHGGGRREYHKVIKQSVTEGFLVRKSGRYHFAETTLPKKLLLRTTERQGKKGNVVTSRGPRKPQNVARCTRGNRRRPRINQLARRRRRRRSVRHRSPRRVARRTARKGTRRAPVRARQRKSPTTRARERRSPTGRTRERSSGHICRPCACGWLHPCEKRGRRRPSEDNGQESPAEDAIQTNNEQEESQPETSTQDE